MKKLMKLGVFFTLMFVVIWMQMTTDRPKELDNIVSQFSDALNPAVYAQNVPGPALGAPVAVAAITTGAGAVTLLPAAGTGVRNYVYEAHCFSNSATAAVATIKAGATTIAFVPCPVTATAGGIVRFDPPLQGPANTAITMTASTAITTAHYYMSGRTAR